MSWFDDLQTRVLQSQTLDDSLSEIGQYIAKSAVDSFTKIVPPPTGNLTPAQIASGQVGTPPASMQIMPSTQYASFMPSSVNPKVIAAVGIGLVGLYFILGRK